ncbi:MAG TPA: hydroxymethylbilane synthase, partial [Chitinophagaceae bacterium]|nr:hydroxymethylbilane synthase [Chitinophagaceae bacterium]
DIAVHSMKDVPTQLAKGIVQAAVLKRGSYKDIFVPHPDLYHRKTKRSLVSVSFQTFSIGSKNFEKLSETDSKVDLRIPLREHPDKAGEFEDIIVATSSVRRIAQWLHRFPNHKIENLRGNVNTRLQKLKNSNWHGAIFAAAGLERIHLRPENSVELDWMLPAPAQGAIMVVCKEDDDYAKQSCALLNDEATATCTKAERDYLKTLMGGCSTPISALAEIKNDMLHFKGNIFSTDGKRKADIAIQFELTKAANAGVHAANEVLKNGGKEIMEEIKSAAK